MKKIFAALLLAMLLALPLVACNKTTNTPPDNGQEEVTETEITGVTFSDVTFDYDGQEHAVTVTGNLPEGVSVSYANNKGTDAGTYNATATLSGTGYKTLTLNANLIINKLTYDTSSVAWDYEKAFVYDGTEKTVHINGLPDGVTIKQYSGNRNTDAGEYTATVSVNYDSVNYNEPVILPCSWTIEKAPMPMTNVSLANDSIEYDTFEHKLQVVGNLPSGVRIEYFYNGVESENGVAEVGSYTVKCVISHKNYVTEELTATLNITSTEKQLFSANGNGSIYFQNDLDGDKLYAVTNTGVQKINNDVPKYMIPSTNGIYYFSNSLFSSVIKSYTTDAAQIYSTQNGEYLASDGTYLYYAINNLLVNTAKNGIYKVAIDGSSDPVRLTADKAEYLTYGNGKLYYSNKSENGYLYSISTSAVEQKGTCLMKEKVSYLLYDNGNLYFDAAKLVGGVVERASAIYRFDLSSNTPIKLTTDSGKYLTKIGNEIFYVNNDLLTSTLFGDGIYKVTANQSNNSSLAGTKVLSATDNGYSSLTTDGTFLYYYKLNDKHFYRNTISGKNEVDLMENFVPTQTTTLTGYSQVAEKDGEIYYTDPADGGCLYKYNVNTRTKIKVLADNVSNVYFYQNYMYYSTYFATNYALFRMDMSTNVSEKINTSRCENLIFDGDKIYYVKIGAPGTYTNYIMQMDLDGNNVTELYKGTNLNIVGFAKSGNEIVFAANPAIGYKTIYKFDLTTKEADNTKINAENLVIENNKIYYYNQREKTFCVCNFDMSDVNTVLEKVEINDMYSDGKTVYFSSVSKDNTGLYAYDIQTGNYRKISDKPAHGMVTYENALYFLQSSVSYTTDYPAQNTSYDGALYRYNGASVEKL